MAGVPRPATPPTAETIDELFTGPVADSAKRRAADVALAPERLAAHHERTST